MTLALSFTAAAMLAVVGACVGQGLISHLNVVGACVAGMVAAYEWVVIFMAWEES